jgi:hypothetical protein
MLHIWGEIGLLVKEEAEMMKNYELDIGLER